MTDLINLTITYKPMSKLLVAVLVILTAHQVQSIVLGHRVESQCPRSKRGIEDDELLLLDSNAHMVCKETSKDPDYFTRHKTGQNPKYLWIGCADSRVIPEHTVGARLGDLFVHRNVANQVNQLDTDVMAVLQYGVEHLKIPNIVVVGHYECGGVKASLADKSYGGLESWLSQIRAVRYENSAALNALPEKERFRRLVELNVEEQVKKISRIPFVQNTWLKGGQLSVMGMVYDLETGLLKTVTKTLKGVSDIPGGVAPLKEASEPHK